jgi:menaquinone-dependent protoporphyrinogen IX oxidase
MRIAIVSAPARQTGKEPPDYVRSLAKGMESMGHRVDILDVWSEDGYKLPSYEYIAVTAEPASFFSGQVNEKIPKMLAAGSSISGKKSAAFVKKTGLFCNKAMAVLMKMMEKEGMVINWFDFLLSPEHAEAMGKRIGA